MNFGVGSFFTGWTAARFFRMSIAGKMLLGYLSLVALIVGMALFALSSLNHLNSLNSRIINTDMPLIEIADRMIDNLLAQELYGKRYMILGSRGSLEMFNKRSEEFDVLLEQIKDLPGGKKLPTDGLTDLYTRYRKLFSGMLAAAGRRGSPSSKRYDIRIRAAQEELISFVKKMAFNARMDQNRKSHMAAELGVTVYRVTGIICIFALIVGAGMAFAVTRNISGAVDRLNFATKQISEGNFDHTPSVRNRDELGELSDSFVEMAGRLKKLEAASLDTSPLTRLPGGIAIENALKARLKEGAPLAFCVIDLDNFKAFNDKYGYARGNEVIQTAAMVIKAAVAEYGTPDDFIGHIGGDDFVVITSPERHAAICSYITDRFDKLVPDLYDSDDRSRGCISGKTRQGHSVSFPLMTISIGIVTNLNRDFESHLQMSEAAAELKEYAKSIPGSAYVIDKRKDGSFDNA